MQILSAAKNLPGNLIPPISLSQTCGYSSFLYTLKTFEFLNFGNSLEIAVRLSELFFPAYRLSERTPVYILWFAYKTAQMHLKKFLDMNLTSLKT